MGWQESNWISFNLRWRRYVNIRTLILPQRVPLSVWKKHDAFFCTHSSSSVERENASKYGQYPISNVAVREMKDDTSLQLVTQPPPPAACLPVSTENVVCSWWWLVASMPRLTPLNWAKKGMNSIAKGKNRAYNTRNSKRSLGYLSFSWEHSMFSLNQVSTKLSDKMLHFEQIINTIPLKLWSKTAVECIV